MSINQQWIKNAAFEEKRLKLYQYFEAKQIVLLGLNDSQGVNISSSFYKKGILEHLASLITNENTTILDLFSLTMNKTEHIDYFLEANLTLEQIKLSQIYSAVSACTKTMQDIHFPKFLGQIGNLYRLNYRMDEKDKHIFLTEALQNSDENIVLYSSGVNNLMRSIGNNPFRIQHDYKQRNKKPNYNYTLEKIKDPNVLNQILNSIRNNLKMIYSLNPNTEIFVMNVYIPHVLKSPKYQVFQELIYQYNHGLEQICDECEATLINVEEIIKHYQTHHIDFHLNQNGYDAITYDILKTIYDQKFVMKQDNKTVQYTKKVYPNNIDHVINKLMYDYNETLFKAEQLEEYPKKRELQIADEHEREIKIMEKVKKATKK